MKYNLIVTGKANIQLDERVFYLIYTLDNKEAAAHLLDEVNKIYDRLEENPFQFPFCRDEHMKRMEYREAIVLNMDYILIFRIEQHRVYILGFFHQLENYQYKM